MVLRKGSTGSLVKYLQRLLNWQGNALVVDGDFGTNTYNAVRNFQTNQGLEVDGVVGTNTWARLLQLHVIDVEGAGATKLVNVAKHELNWGFVDENNNDKTPYGEWYGQNGSPWSGMFISWCARHAGILNVLVPRFSDCPSGVTWYQNKGRFYTRLSGYTPNVGDTVFFWSSSLNKVVHSGIVTEVTSSTIKTIEGNCNSKVSAYSYSRTSTYIHGYGNNSVIPLTEDETNALYEKWSELLKSTKFVNYVLNYTFDREMPLVNSSNLKVTCKFSPGLSVFTNKDAMFTAQVTDGEIMFGTTDYGNFLKNSFEYDIEQKYLQPVFDLGKTVGNGEVKISIAYTPTGFIKISLCFGAEIQLTTGTKAEYSYEFVIEFRPDNSDSNSPEPSAEKVFEKIQSFVTSKKVVLGLVGIGVAIFMFYMGGTAGLVGVFAKFVALLKSLIPTIAL